MNTLQNVAVKLSITSQKTYERIPPAYGQRQYKQRRTVPELSEKELYCCRVATD